MRPVNNKYLKKNDDLIEEKNEPIDTKEYVLSKLKIFNDVGFYKPQIDVMGNRKLIAISLNGHKLLHAWIINYNFSNFNVREINDEYGKYLLIPGKFLYTVPFTNRIPRTRGGSFYIGFINCSNCIIFRKGEFNEKLFTKKNKNIIFSQDIDDCKYIMTDDSYSIF